MPSTGVPATVTDGRTLNPVAAGLEGAHAAIASKLPLLSELFQVGAPGEVWWCEFRVGG